MGLKMSSVVGYAGRVAVGLCLLVAFGLPHAVAQDLFGFANPWSPFVYPPGLRGEVNVTPIFLTIVRGQERIEAARPVVSNLRDQYGMTPERLFLDTMVKLSVGRWSIRGYYEPRDFFGERVTLVSGVPTLAQARLDYSGIRIGGDVDIFLPYGIYLGANLDYDLYHPIFTEAIQPGSGVILGSGKKIQGNAPLTLGMHVVANPVTSYYGMSPIFEARVRWPVSGAAVTDVELSGGLRTPETILGSVALKFGWRQTEISFTRPQVYNGLPVSTDFDAVIGGWFGQFCYYY
jgi:hypothetical protein